MAIEITHQFKNGILRVVAKGRDDNLEQVQEYGRAVMAAALESECNRIICDETGLVYSLDTFDTFELARALSETIPRDVKVALVCNPAQFADASFWETVAVNRGVQVRVFKEMAGAEKWMG